jgi:hypothetical protein
MEKGWKLEGNNESLTLSCNGKKITFYIKLQTSCGTLFAILIDPKVEIDQFEINARNGNTAQSTRKIDMSNAHQLFGLFSLKGTK